MHLKTTVFHNINRDRQKPQNHKKVILCIITSHLNVNVMLSNITFL